MTRFRPVPATVRLVPLLLAGLLLSACGGGVESKGDQGYVSGNGVITVLDEEDRYVPEEVSGESLEGEPLSLSSYDGKVVVINVWGAWCPPCRAEADDLAVAAKELQPEGVAFLGINTRDTSRDNALSFQRSREVPYPSIYDPSGRTLLAFRGSLRPNSIPSTLVLDEQGRVAATVLGELTSARTLVSLVEEVRG